MINSKNIIEYIKFLYQKKYYKEIPPEILNSWENLKDDEIQNHLAQLYKKWNLNDISINMIEQAFLSNKTVNRKSRRAYFFIGICVLLILLFVFINNKNNDNIHIGKNMKDNNSKVEGNKSFHDKALENSEKIVVIHEKLNVDTFKNIIHSLINAENNRDFNTIYSFFSNEMVRYWDIQNPNYKKLKNRYEYLWNITTNNSHTIVEIYEYSSHHFVLKGIYTYFSIIDKKEKKINTEVHYIFDSSYKIIEVWGI